MFIVQVYQPRHRFPVWDGHCGKTASAKYQTWSDANVKNSPEHRQPRGVFKGGPHAVLQWLCQVKLRAGSKVFHSGSIGFKYVFWCSSKGRTSTWNWKIEKCNLSFCFNVPRSRLTAATPLREVKVTSPTPCHLSVMPMCWPSTDFCGTIRKRSATTSRRLASTRPWEGDLSTRWPHFWLTWGRQSTGRSTHSSFLGRRHLFKSDLLLETCTHLNLSIY